MTDVNKVVEQLHALSLFASRRLLNKSEHTILKGVYIVILSFAVNL